MPSYLMISFQMWTKPGWYQIAVLHFLEHLPIGVARQTWALCMWLGLGFSNLINTQEHPDVLRSLSQCAAECISPVYWHIRSNTACWAGFLAAVLNKYLKEKIDLISMTLLNPALEIFISFHFLMKCLLLKHKMVTLSVPKSCP